MFRVDHFVIEAGKSYTLRMVPVVQSSTNGFKALPLEKRECRLSNEIIDGRPSIFRFYTQKSCIFECTLKTAVLEVSLKPV
jgi:hypothetical protein